MEMDHTQVIKILPHRPPMFFVDTVTELTPMEQIETKFYIDPELDIFNGHFLGDPVFPGVLSVECIAQAVDIVIISDQCYAGKTPLFSGIDTVRFFHKICPGDTVTCKVSVREINHVKNKVTCEGELYVDDEPAVIAKVIATMR